MTMAGGFRWAISQRFKQTSFDNAHYDYYMYEYSESFGCTPYRFWNWYCVL